MATASPVIAVETAGAVCTVTLNRPESLNSLNEKMLSDLADAIQQIKHDERIRCMILTGAGRAFCSGQDLGELKAQYTNPAFVPYLEEGLKHRYNPVVLGLRELEKPVIAAMNGVAAGAGLSLALACDLRIASDKASLIEVFINVGLVPDAGSTYFLPRLVGLSKALELCFTGDKVGANEALTLGLVNKVVPADDLMKTTNEFANRLAKLPTRAIGLAKRLLNQSLNVDLHAQLNAEAAAQGSAGQSADHREGVLAFFDKRPPNFQGK